MSDASGDVDRDLHELGIDLDGAALRERYGRRHGEGGGCAANLVRRPSMSHFETSSAFARALNRIIAEDRFTVQEMAEVAGCSDRHLYKVRAGEADLTAGKAELLARWLCRHGETRLSTVFLCPSHTIVRRLDGRSNGSVRDEVVAIVHALSAAEAGHQRRDPEALAASITEIRQALADLEAELASIRG